MTTFPPGAVCGPGPLWDRLRVRFGTRPLPSLVKKSGRVGRGQSERRWCVYPRGDTAAPGACVYVATYVYMDVYTSARACGKVRTYTPRHATPRWMRHFFSSRTRLLVIARPRHFAKAQAAQRKRVQLRVSVSVRKGHRVIDTRKCDGDPGDTRDADQLVCKRRVCPATHACHVDGSVAESRVVVGTQPSKTSTRRGTDTAYAFGCINSNTFMP